MNYYTIEAVFTAEISKLTKLIWENEYHEYDCDRETYAQFILRALLEDPAYVSWILCETDTNEDVGYLIAYRDKFLFNEVVVLDVFIKPELQGKGLIAKLLEELIEFSIKDGAKRIKWHSHVLPSEYWKKYNFGAELHEYKEFSCPIDGEFPKIFENTRKEFVNKCVE